MKVKYLTTLVAASIVSLGLVVGCSENPCGAKETTPSSETNQVDPCAGANPCAAKENPCAGADPCAGKENPCAGADPCAGK